MLEKSAQVCDSDSKCECALKQTKKITELSVQIIWKQLNNMIFFFLSLEKNHSFNDICLCISFHSFNAGDLEYGYKEDTYFIT